MKTPRELLLARHEQSGARLETIRAVDLAACARTASAAPARQSPLRPARIPFFQKFWAESILPWKSIWLGIAAVWVIILGFGVSSSPAPRLARAEAPAPPPEARLVLREQRQMMAQLLEQDQPASGSQSKGTGPRGERFGPRGLRRAALEFPSSIPGQAPIVV